MRRRKKTGESRYVLKARVLLVCLVCLLGLANVAWSDSKAFYENGTIQEGELYSYVSLFDEAIVDMTGGAVTKIFTAYESSIANISGGSLNILDCWDFATLNFSSNAVANQIGVSFSGVLNVYGGSVDVMKVGTLGGAYLHNSVISDYLSAGSTVDVYGYGFSYNPDAGDWRGGQLTGFWANDQPFVIDLFFDDTPGGATIDTWSHIVLHEIPEPCTLSLLAVGAIMLLRRQ